MDNYPQTDPEQFEIPGLPEAAPPPEPVAARFPWPPAEGENVLQAAFETWRRSLFHPTHFFRELPTRGYGSALAYFMPLGVLGAGLELFWSTVFAALGVDLTIEGLLGMAEPGANPALERLIGFLLSPITLFLTLFVAGGLFHLMLKILGAASRPLVTTVRVVAFGSGTYLFFGIPLLGPALSGTWSLVISVIGLREAHATTTMRAAAAVFLPLVLLFMLIAVIGIIAVLALVALGLNVPR